MGIESAGESPLVLLVVGVTVTSVRRVFRRRWARESADAFEDGGIRGLEDEWCGD